MVSKEVFQVIAGFVLLAAMIGFVVFMQNAGREACKQVYGESARLHSTRGKTECILPDGTIKGVY